MRPKINKTKQVEDSITALIRLFEIIIASPEDFIDNAIIRQALKSQGGTTKLNYAFYSENITHCIRPLSLTTLKSKISTISEGLTWDAFDQLRRQALDSIEHASALKAQAPKTTKIGLKDSLTIAKLNLEKQREINFRLLQAIGQSIATLDGIVSITDENLRAKRIRDAKETIYKCLSLNEYPFNKTERTATILTLHPDKNP